MCIGLWSLEHPDYAFILCTNRDEFLDRPTKDAAFHSFDTYTHDESRQASILSGRDVRAGGTWFGISKTGKIALLTNIPGPPPAGNISSRGHLVSSYLLSGSSLPLEDQVGAILPRDTRFAGFNMLLLAPSKNSTSDSPTFDASFVSNGGTGSALHIRPLSEAERRCGGISNGVDSPGAPDLPKVKIGKSQLDALLSRHLQESELVSGLFDILAWRPDAPAHPEPRDTICTESVLKDAPDDGEPEWYGTRLSTILLVRRDGRVLFIEKDIWKLDEDANALKADPQSQRTFRFSIEPWPPT